VFTKTVLVPRKYVLVPWGFQDNLEKFIESNINLEYKAAIG